ncbi:hypothetical protein AM493_17795 [Flavobacterium akiainvivens]|uniref:Uncharacterized protein n=1 Tax=Flavobacterium akiainvivens TaxID=1202724 RepID=A0A0M9VJE8_9FLAO|nr:hypothetical protein [Flavobacterium akiainvivens]KOS07690.1 hypothetical protein AM493_17795 [Flavobacterium akiainvivens]SFQ24314.1 hypothetical protein SAMN05444144_102140 [Flavobacterium akiainvivens]
MKRFNLLYSSLFALAAFPAVAQINQTPIHSNGNQIFTTAEEKLKTEGSMYYQENYMPAKIEGTDEIVLLRYNAYLDQFEINNQQEQTQGVIAKEADKDITFSGGDTFAYVQYKDDKGQQVNGYLEVINNGPKVKIFKSQKIYLQPGKPSRNSYQSAKAPVLKQADAELFIQLPNSTQAVPFDGKKDLAKVVGKEKEVLDYIKQNKLDVEKDTDLQKLATYVETII